MAGESVLTTPLSAWHQAHGGRMVEFAGWSMPVQYTSIVEEHRAVRNGVGLFDISHMGRLLFQGPDAADWLNHLTTNDVSRLVDGQIQYSLMTDAQGGILDDVLVYRVPSQGHDPAHSTHYLLVCNASNRAKVIDQLQRLQGGRKAEFQDQTVGGANANGTAMIAVQGPAAFPTIERLLREPVGPLKTYHMRVANLFDSSGAVLCSSFLSRTGYTGEEGVELITPGADASRVWEALMEAGREFGIRPCGLGARDTLRFEAAMPLYGHELSESINPYEAGLGRFVQLDKGEFIGREALQDRKSVV